MALIFLVVGTVIGVIVFLTTHVDRVPRFHNVSTFLFSLCERGRNDRNVKCTSDVVVTNG